MKLRGKGAIVTGAGSGIGEAVALSFAEEGAEVVTVGRTLSKLERAKEDAGAAGARLHPYALDVADADAAVAMVAWAAERLPQIDILVNNAGTNVAGRALDKLSREDFETVVAVNLNGPFYLLQAVLPGMRERGDGVVITVSSTAGVRTSVVAGASYSASKHGARALSLATPPGRGGPRHPVLRHLPGGGEHANPGPPSGSPPGRQASAHAPARRCRAGCAAGGHAASARKHPRTRDHPDAAGILLRGRCRRGRLAGGRIRGFRGSAYSCRA